MTLENDSILFCRQANFLTLQAYCQNLGTFVDVSLQCINATALGVLSEGGTNFDQKSQSG